MIDVLAIVALALFIGQLLIVARVIERSEQLAEAEAAAACCRSCGRTLRPGILSPYPCPCICRRSRRHV